MAKSRKTASDKTFNYCIEKIISDCFDDSYSDEAGECRVKLYKLKAKHDAAARRAAKQKRKKVKR